MEDGAPIEGIAARAGVVASERYDTEIERDDCNCTSWVKVSARYTDPWETPMAGARFQILQNGVVIEENRLKNMADVGAAPNRPMTAEQRAELGTFTKPEVEPGAIEFVILQEAPEAQVLQLEQSAVDRTAQSVAQIRNHYQSQWERWNEASSAGRGALLIQESFEGFLTGVGDWWEEEQGFWSMIADVFSSAWEAIKDTVAAIGTALHPDNIMQTAQAVWDGARSALEGVGEFIGNLSQRAQDFYAGTMRIINNIGAITEFIRDFAAGDDAGVQAFVRNTLPLLIEDDSEAAEWRGFIENNAEAWQLILEIVKYTKGPALIIACVTGICAAVPPQVWAGWGVASVVTVVIEVVISAVIGFLAAATTALSGGAATAAMGAVVVGRSAKWARMGARFVDNFQALMTHVDEVIDRVVAMGQIAVRARRRMTTTNGTQNGGTASTVEQRRDADDSGNNCRVCNKELGVNGHPARAPDRNGITGRSGSARSTAYAGPGGFYNDLSVGSLMKSAQPSMHPVHNGITMTHHHILMVSFVDRHAASSKLERLGYVVHDEGNLVLMPNHEFGACHLQTQLHVSRHTTATIPTGASTSYTSELNRGVAPVLRKLRNSDFCRGTHAEIQSDMNDVSEEILDQIDAFAIQIQNNNHRFRPGEPGCGQCAGTRMHGIGAIEALRVNHPQQSTSRSEMIAFMGSVPWSLRTGR